LAKKTSNALERLDQVEKTVGNIVGAVNNSLGQVSQQLSGITEVLDAVVQTLGAETIQKLMTESRQAKAEAQAQAEEAALKELLAKGDIKATEKISEKSIVVGRETAKDGTVRIPGRAQVAFARIDPNFQSAFLGQGPGFSLDLPNGGKFEVLEVFEVVEKADSPPADAPAATATEPAAP
jgi:hypothetical protein